MNTSVREPYIFSVPNVEDFRSVAALQTLAFEAKRERFESAAEVEEEHFKTYQRYARECPEKLELCRIIRSAEDGKTILAACQLNKRKRLRTNDDDNCEHIVFVEEDV